MTWVIGSLFGGAFLSVYASLDEAITPAAGLGGAIVIAVVVTRLLQGVQKNVVSQAYAALATQEERHAAEIADLRAQVAEARAEARTARQVADRAQRRDGKKTAAIIALNAELRDVRAQAGLPERRNRIVDDVLEEDTLGDEGL